MLYRIATSGSNTHFTVSPPNRPIIQPSNLSPLIFPSLLSSSLSLPFRTYRPITSTTILNSKSHFLSYLSCPKPRFTSHDLRIASFAQGGAKNVLKKRTFLLIFVHFCSFLLIFAHFFHPTCAFDAKIILPFLPIPPNPRQNKPKQSQFKPGA